MGFFSNLTSSIVNFVGNGIGIVVEKVGIALSWDTLEYAGLSLQAACNFGEHRWDSDSSADDTAEVHSRLDQFKLQIIPQANSKEEILTTQYVNEISSLLNLFSSIFPEQKLAHLEREYRNKISQKLSGSIMLYIEPRLSFSNEHCKEILSKPDGVRQRSATEYQNQLLENAENEFRSKCNKVYLELVESVCTDVQVQLNALQKEYNEKMALLTRLQEESPDETLIDYERASLTVLKTNLEVLSDIASH